jgi:DNA topoisomerase
MVPAANRVHKDNDAQVNISRLPANGQEANNIILRARAGEAVIESLSSETQRMQPPQLYDLTELQRHANRLFGFSAQGTLDLAQALYGQHKLISYLRTDSRHLSADVAATAPNPGPYVLFVLKWIVPLMDYAHAKTSIRLTERNLQTKLIPQSQISSEGRHDDPHI